MDAKKTSASLSIWFVFSQITYQDTKVIKALWTFILLKRNLCILSRWKKNMQPFLILRIAEKSLKSISVRTENFMNNLWPLHFIWQLKSLRKRALQVDWKIHFRQFSSRIRKKRYWPQLAFEMLALPATAACQSSSAKKCLSCIAVQFSYVNTNTFVTVEQIGRAKTDWLGEDSLNAGRVSGNFCFSC